MVPIKPLNTKNTALPNDFKPKALPQAQSQNLRTTTSGMTITTMGISPAASMSSTQKISRDAELKKILVEEEAMNTIQGTSLRNPSG